MAALELDESVEDEESEGTVESEKGSEGGVSSPEGASPLGASCPWADAAGASAKRMPAVIVDERKRLPVMAATLAGVAIGDTFPGRRRG